MAGLIEEYLEKRAAAVQAEQAMTELVKSLYAASHALGDGSPHGLSSWKNLYVPDIPAPSTQRQTGARKFPSWPIQSEALEKAAAYWTAIDAADKAFALLPPHLRQGLQPPPR